MHNFSFLCRVMSNTYIFSSSLAWIMLRYAMHIAANRCCRGENRLFYVISCLSFLFIYSLIYISSGYLDIWA
jgi:hypothetical protein